MPTLSELGKILIASRVVSVERWKRAAKLGRGDLAKTLDAIAADPPDWWTDTGNTRPEDVPPGLTDYQRAVIELWADGVEEDLPRQLSRNHFILLDKLGEGGQGAVYRARQINPGRFVAVKMLAEHSEVRRQRFEQEARAMMKIQHGAVARFHLYERVRDASGHPTEEYLIAMEYVDGNDLSRMIHVLGPIPWQFAARWAVSLLEGLAVIHKSGFIHRDVKPANVMVLGPLPEPGVAPHRTSAKLLDFGAVKPADEAGGTGSRRIFVGTREYAAPEQWEERPVPESDVYALAATLFHAITGRPPYEVEDRDAIALMKAHMREPIPQADDYAEVPNELNALLYRMMSKDPEERGSAAELALVFREMLPRGDGTPSPSRSRPPLPPKPGSAVHRSITARDEPKPEPKSIVHAILHPILLLPERIFLPKHLRAPAGHEPPLNERLATLLRRPMLLLTLLILVGLVVWLVLLRG
jgi:serine/threonine protein kinase